MFVAMNRFKVVPGSEAAFEEVWRNRNSRLDEMAGFVKFDLLRGPASAAHTLYASHTIWESETAFLAWTNSEQFRAAHRDAGKNKPLSHGHPEFEGFTRVDLEKAPELERQA
jgi:heme-degrading monooxygenase HmoA